MARYGSLVHMATVGSQDLQTGVPMSERTLFRMYSMTRPITSTAEMMVDTTSGFRFAVV